MGCILTRTTVPSEGYQKLFNSKLTRMELENLSKIATIYDRLSTELKDSLSERPRLNIALDCYGELRQKHACSDRVLQIKEEYVRMAELRIERIRKIYYSHIGHA